MKFPEEKKTPFIEAYIEALLWSSVDDNEVPLDKNYDINSFSTRSINLIIAQCEAFQKENEKEIGEDGEQAGHDFWLTRNYHGAGFWDRENVYGEKESKILTEKSHTFGECTAIVGDDGEIDLC